MDKRIWRYSTITRTTRDGTKEFYLYISEYGAFDCDILRQRDELAAACRNALLGYHNLVEFGHIPNDDADVHAMIGQLETALANLDQEGQ